MDARAELRPSLYRRAATSSLNRKTGSHRRYTTVRVDLREVRTVAHNEGATANDLVLAAVTATLHQALLERGRSLQLPATGPPYERLCGIAQITRDAKSSPRGASTALLSPTFRLLAGIGLYRWFIDRQTLVNTCAAHPYGPSVRLMLDEWPIESIVPLSITTGNVTVSFAVLSYAGQMVVTVVADSAASPDLRALPQRLRRELDELLSPEAL